jgi:conjugal transfer pilin signal peptidase TrbI
MIARIKLPSVSDLATDVMYGRGPAFMEKLGLHCKRQWPAYALLFLLCALLMKHYSIGLNATNSLKDVFYVVEKNAQIVRGDYVAFKWRGGGPYKAGSTFVKKLAGVPGDQVTLVERGFFVNGVAVGEAKPVSLKGAPLELGPVGRLPEGRYYVMAPHKDSLDSRYALMGWVEQDQLVGKVIWKMGSKE